MEEGMCFFIVLFFGCGFCILFFGFIDGVDIGLWDKIFFIGLLFGFFLWKGLFFFIIEGDFWGKLNCLCLLL